LGGAGLTIATPVPTIWIARAGDVIGLVDLHDLIERVDDRAHDVAARRELAGNGELRGEGGLAAGRERARHRDLGEDAVRRRRDRRAREHEAHARRAVDDAVVADEHRGRQHLARRGGRRGADLERGEVGRRIDDADRRIAAPRVVDLGRLGDAVLAVGDEREVPRAGAGARVEHRLEAQRRDLAAEHRQRRAPRDHGVGGDRHERVP
jgi:hypothetical protein